MTTARYREAYNIARERIDELLADAEELASLPEGVTIERDGSGWFVQCAHLDYFAGGDTPADAVRRFRSGLQETILLNLLRSGVFAPKPTAGQG